MTILAPLTQWYRSHPIGVAWLRHFVWARHQFSGRHRQFGLVSATEMEFSNRWNEQRFFLVVTSFHSLSSIWFKQSKSSLDFKAKLLDSPCTRCDAMLKKCTLYLHLHVVSAWFTIRFIHSEAKPNDLISIFQRWSLLLLPKFKMFCI